MTLKHRCLKYLMVVLGCTTAVHGQELNTAKMKLVFKDSWLVKWENKETGETINFSRPSLQPGTDDATAYAPGPWRVGWKKLAAGVKPNIQWSTKYKLLGPTTVALSQNGSGNVDVQSLQWSINVPMDKISAVYKAHGFAPARIAAKDSPSAVFYRSSPDFSRRNGWVGYQDWRYPFYQIQAKKGGLIIYFDDPEFNHRPLLETKLAPDHSTMILANRSFCEPPWKKKYNGGRWVIAQYSGPVGMGAQIYQDYLKKTYKIKPIKNRPTAWILKLAFGITGTRWVCPLPYKNLKAPFFNYTDKYDESIAFNLQWLKNLAKVLPPENTMFYWPGGVHRQWGHDMMLPSQSIDPFFLSMAPYGRKMGYHMMLHFNFKWLYKETPGWKKYFESANRKLNRDPNWGVFHNALRNQLYVKKEHKLNAWNRSLFQDVKMQRMLMTPATETWRRLLVTQIVTAVKSTGVDMLHIDVPDVPIDLYNERYGMNAAQGVRETFKLLRETLDQQGLAHVAIATEMHPPLPALPYVDMAQSSRDKSAEALASGKFVSKIVELGTGVQSDEEMKKRAAELKKRSKKKVDIAQLRKALSNYRDLGEPCVGIMATGPFILGYQHLGTLSPLSGGGRRGKQPNAAQLNQVSQALMVWFSFTSNTILHSAFSQQAFYDTKPWDKHWYVKKLRNEVKYGHKGKRKKNRFFTRFDYAKFALARFWAVQNPVYAKPDQWKAGEIARYNCNDGKVLVVKRKAPLVMSWEYTDGKVIAEMDIFKGWQNNDWLMKNYAPVWLKDQIDEYVK